MIKLFTRVVLFAAIFILVFRSLEKYFIKADRFNYTKYYFNKVSDTLDFDALFFGSSKAYCSYNPSIIKYQTGLNSYNLAGQGQVLEVTNFILEESLKESNPNLVIVDLSQGMIAFNPIDSLASKSKSYQLKILDNYSLSINKLSYVSSIYNNSEFIYALSPIFRNHNEWFNSSQQNYKTDYLTGKNNFFLSNNGYIGTMHEMAAEGLKIAEQLKQGYNSLLNKNSLKVKPYELEVIEHTIKIAKDNNVELLFITAPSIKGYVNHLSFYEELEKLFKKRNIKYLNLNRFFFDIGLSAKDFKDTQHLNYSGGYKVSLFLSNYISKTFNLKEKSNFNHALDNNVTYHMFSNLKHTQKILSKTFQFDSKIKVEEISYFKEIDNRYSFIFKLGNDVSKNKIEQYRGYMRIFKEAINEENKQIIDFPMKVIDIGREKYIFARGYLEKTNISQLDIFFIDSKSKKASNYLSLKDLKLLQNAY